MLSESVIDVRNVCKNYQIYSKPHHRLQQMIFGKIGKDFFTNFSALKNISFKVQPGKVVGILGKNGAGKSTLLQIICGTLAPSQGSISVNGRVAALLELGSGFNPEFSGIENIFFNGQLLGLTHSEIETRLEKILKFADIGDFVNQPVKTYSSGMFARLAFSVAVHVDPDILIIDEALSVGDAWFQHKSMAKMRQMMSTGCSVLFVSHSIDSVRALCDEAIWLDAGSIKMQGDVTEVTNAYMNDVFIENNRITLQAIEQSSHGKEEVLENGEESATHDQISDIPSEAAQTALVVDIEKIDQNLNSDGSPLDGSRILTVTDIRLRNSTGELTNRLNQGESFSLEFDIEFVQALRNISLGILIKDQFGQDLTGESYFNSHRHSLHFLKGQKACFKFASNMILRGGQSYSIAARINQVSKWDRSDNIHIYADELSMVFDVLSDIDNPMWFKFKMPFEVTCT